MSIPTLIYVASSWRNEYQPTVVEGLRGAGYGVYDFHTQSLPFKWESLRPDYKHGDKWMPRLLEIALGHSAPRKSFEHDMKAMRRAAAVVLVLPAGRSAHLEAGWAVGAGKPVFIYSVEPLEPELMYLMNGINGDINISMEELLFAMRDREVLP